MRHKRPDLEENLRYRRRRRAGRTNAVRIAAVVTVAVGIVVGSLIFTSTVELDSIVESTATSGSQIAFGANRGSAKEIDSSNPLAPAGTGSSSTRDVSTSDTNSGEPIDSAPGDIEGVSPSAPSADGNAGETPATSCQTVVSGCTISGRVTDDWGASMAGVRVYVTTSSGTIVETVTDHRGRYTLPAPTPDAVSVTVALASMTDSGNTFAVMVGDDIISLSVAIDPESSGCEINFDSWNVQEQMVASPVSVDLWPDAASIYQYTRNAQSLAINLGADIETATPLQIQAWCTESSLGCDISERGAYFIAENELGENSPPIIALLPSRSSAKSPGTPDNREYHEYGHYFLSLQTGDNFELPLGDTNHGGYYKNSSTRDSFVEGFAEFYSMMVSRTIDNDPNAEMYTIGADYDLETDRLPWEAAGWWEEFTIAGLLLDLVDDDADYLPDTSGFTGVSILEVSTENEPSGTIISGRIVNNSPLVVRNAEVTVRYLNDAGEVVGTQVTRILPELIASTREGAFFAAPPAGLNVTQATATLGGIAKSDDDETAVDLRQLMSMITEYERDDGKLGVSNVAELYDALSEAIESQSGRNTGFGAVTIAQIDELFVNHGFFADLDGDRMYSPAIDGPIGESSHPVTEIGEISFPAFIPRQDPDAYDGSFVTIDTGDADVDAIIQISLPADGGSGSYAYIAPKGGSGRVELAVPPANQNAEVTIITAGKDYRPVIAFRVDADDFHKKVENGTISELQVEPVELGAGAAIVQPGNDGTAIQLGVILGGIVAVFVVVASLIAIRRQWGKT